MKYYLTLIILFTTISSHADTISSWTVYLNGVKLKTFTEFTNNKLHIKSSQLKKGTDLAIQYHDDTPCSDCTYEMIINDEYKNTIATTRFKNQNKKVHLNLAEVVKDYKANEKPKFYLIFFNEFYKGKLTNGGVRLFTLTID